MSNTDDDDRTPRPGEIVAFADAAAIISRFEGRFRVHESNRDPRVPTWCTFEASDSHTTNWQSSSVLPDALGVFVYFEGGRELRRAEMADVRRYVSALEPWEDWDLYVFDDTYSWRVAVTHLQQGEQRLVIAAGCSLRPTARAPRSRSATSGSSFGNRQNQRLDGDWFCVASPVATGSPFSTFATALGRVGHRSGRACAVAGNLLLRFNE